MLSFFSVITFMLSFFSCYHFFPAIIFEIMFFHEFGHNFAEILAKFIFFPGVGTRKVIVKFCPDENLAKTMQLLCRGRYEKVVIFCVTTSGN